MKKTGSNYVMLLFSFLLCITAKAQEYQHLQRPGKLAGQQMYVLPKATIVLEVHTVKTEYKRGPGYKNYRSDTLQIFSDKYGVDTTLYRRLRNNATITEVELAEDSLELTLLAAPDYDKIFYVNSKSKWNKNQTVTFTYGNDGILLEGESLYEDKTLDIIVKGLSSVVSFVGAVGALKADPAGVKIKDLDDALQNFDKLDGQNDYSVYKDLKATYEKKYTKAFGKHFYSEKKTEKIIKIYYTPAKDTAQTKQVRIFKLNQKTGDVIVDSALANEAWGKKLKFGSVTDSAYVLQFTRVREQLSNNVLERNDLLHKGCAYNVPAKMDVTVIDYKHEIIYQDIFKIAQFGKVGYTDTRKEKITFSLDPVTGELKKLSIEGKAVMTDQVGAVGTVATDAAKLIKGDDAATKLDKEVKRLENEKKKRDLLKELENE
jgi:hypothetical protein